MSSPRVTPRTTSNSSPRSSSREPKDSLKSSILANSSTGWSPLRISKRDSSSSPSPQPHPPLPPSNGGGARRSSSSFSHVKHHSLVSNSPFKSDSAATQGPIGPRYRPVPQSQAGGYALSRGEQLRPTKIPTSLTRRASPSATTRRVSDGGRKKRVSSGDQVKQMLAKEAAAMGTAPVLNRLPAMAVQSPTSQQLKYKRRQSNGLQGLVKAEYVSKSPFLEDRARNRSASGNSQPEMEQESDDDHSQHDDHDYYDDIPPQNEPPAPPPPPPQPTTPTRRPPHSRSYSQSSPAPTPPPHVSPSPAVIALHSRVAALAAEVASSPKNRSPSISPRGSPLRNFQDRERVAASALSFKADEAESSPRSGSPTTLVVRDASPVVTRDSPSPSPPPTPTKRAAAVPNSSATPTKSALKSKRRLRGPRSRSPSRSPERRTSTPRRISGGGLMRIASNGSHHSPLSRVGSNGSHKTHVYRRTSNGGRVIRLRNGSLRRERRKTVTWDEKCDVVEYEVDAAEWEIDVEYEDSEEGEVYSGEEGEEEGEWDMEEAVFSQPGQNGQREHREEESEEEMHYEAMPRDPVKNEAEVIDGLVNEILEAEMKRMSFGFEGEGGEESFSREMDEDHNDRSRDRDDTRHDEEEGDMEPFFGGVERPLPVPSPRRSPLPNAIVRNARTHSTIVEMDETGEGVAIFSRDLARIPTMEDDGAETEEELEEVTDPGLAGRGSANGLGAVAYGGRSSLASEQRLSLTSEHHGGRSSLVIEQHGGRSSLASEHILPEMMASSPFMLDGTINLGSVSSMDSAVRQASGSSPSQIPVRSSHAYSHSDPSPVPRHSGDYTSSSPSHGSPSPAGRHPSPSAIPRPSDAAHGLSRVDSLTRSESAGSGTAASLAVGGLVRTESGRFSPRISREEVKRRLMKHRENRESGSGSSPVGAGASRGLPPVPTMPAATGHGGRQSPVPAPSSVGRQSPGPMASAAFGRQSPAFTGRQSPGPVGRQSPGPISRQSPGHSRSSSPFGPPPLHPQQQQRLHQRQQSVDMTRQAQSHDAVLQSNTRDDLVDPPRPSLGARSRSSDARSRSSDASELQQRHGSRNTSYTVIPPRDHTGRPSVDIGDVRSALDRLMIGVERGFGDEGTEPSSSAPHSKPNSRPNSMVFSAGGTQQPISQHQQLVTSTMIAKAPSMSPRESMTTNTTDEGDEDEYGPQTPPMNASVHIPTLGREKAEEDRKAAMGVVDPQEEEGDEDDEEVHHVPPPPQPRPQRKSLEQPAHQSRPISSLYTTDSRPTSSLYPDSRPASSIYTDDRPPSTLSRHKSGKELLKDHEARILAKRREMRQRSGGGGSGSSREDGEGRRSKRRSLSTGDAEDLTSNASSARRRARNAGLDLDLMVVDVDETDLPFTDSVERELSKMFDGDTHRKYRLRERSNVIYAADEKVTRTGRAGKQDSKAWRVVRRPSDMNEYSRQIREFRAQEKPGKSCGKVFVKVLGIKGIDIPIPADPTFFNCTLNNGIHCVATPDARLMRDSKIDQEFELIEHGQLEFTLTIKVRKDPHVVAQMHQPASAPQPPPRMVAPPVVIAPTPVPQKSGGGGFFGFFGNTPKKAKMHKRAATQPEIRARQPPQILPPPAPTPAPPRAIQENLARYLRPDGTLGRAFISFKEIAKRCDTRLFETSFSLIGQKAEQGGNTTPQAIGDIVLQIFRLPPLPGVPPQDLPQSLEECHRGLRHIAWHKVMYHEGILTQNGGDCMTWRRRHIRVIGSNLVAYNDVTKKPTTTIELKKAIGVEDNEELNLPISQRHSRSDDDGNFHVRHSFRLVFPDGENIAFYADDDEDKSKWLDILRALIGRIPPNPLWAELVWQRQEDLAAAASEQESITPPSPPSNSAKPGPSRRATGSVAGLQR